jgi:hypothetical protein
MELLVLNAKCFHFFEERLNEIGEVYDVGHFE